MKWTKKEIEFLKNNWYDLKPKLILERFPDRNMGAIRQQAHRLGLKRILKKPVMHDLSCLLENSPISYYWIGFLLADGHFSKYKISLSLSNKDKSHLIKYKKYIKSKNKIYNDPRGFCGIDCSDSNIVPEIIKKFDISNRKTYNPPNLLDIDKGLLFPLIIGFIDGDGTIWKYPNKNSFGLSVRCHKSWLKNLSLFHDSLYEIFNEPLSNNRKKTLKGAHLVSPKNSYSQSDIAKFQIQRHSLLKKIKSKAQETDLPILERKWLKIT